MLCLEAVLTNILELAAANRNATKQIPQGMHAHLI
jgi:hypothetical protein